MKKFIYLGLLLLGTKVMAQDYAAYELPEYTAVADDSTDVLYIDDSGVDKHIEMPTFIKMVHDSVHALRVSGTGTGIVDTTGLPVANQVTYWTAAAKIGGDAGFTFDGDSIKLGIFSPVTKYAWLYVDSANSSMKVDSSVQQASWMLTHPVDGIKTFMADVHNGEINYQYKIGDEIINCYGLQYGNDPPGVTFEKLTAMDERILRYVLDLEYRVDDMKKSLNVLYCTCGAFVILITWLLIVYIRKR